MNNHFTLQSLELPDNSPYNTKLIVGNYKYPVTITKKDQTLWFQFGYVKPLLEEIKQFEGATWHGFKDPPIKQWSVSDSIRNRFRIAFMEGKNPYKPYDLPLIEATPRRERKDFPNDQYFYDHQIDIFRHCITYRYVEVAAEMGTGKTLSVIEALEWFAANGGIQGCFYCAPKSALTSVLLEFERWKSFIRPQFYTYETLNKIVANWPSGSKPPQTVIFDESSRLKTPTSQRSVAARHLAHAVRNEWGDSGVVIGMSGSPAPNKAIDWWHQAEIICPGFLKEGNLDKCRKRLAFLKEGTNDANQIFIQVAGWRDNEKKCHFCGKLESDIDHDVLNMGEEWYHTFQPSVNEISLLYKRLKGLVIVKLKKDCLDLPEKQFKIIDCKPTDSILNAARLIVARGESGIKTSMLLRELSDGFQYQMEDIGTKECPLCEGTRSVVDWKYVGPDEKYEQVLEDQSIGKEVPKEYFEQVQQACSYCHGSGEVTDYKRETAEVPCPKEDALLELIDQHEDVGRLVVYAGFTGSVDRCVRAFVKKDWDYIRLDGRGWQSSLQGGAVELIKKFQYNKSEYSRVGFIGHPAAAGMGLTLTASPTEIFYSNDTKPESRIQAVDRIHRPGMDINKGATIIDLCHLPTDRLMLKALNDKRNIELMTLGEFKAVLEEPGVRE